MAKKKKKPVSKRRPNAGRSRGRVTTRASTVKPRASATVKRPVAPATVKRPGAARLHAAFVKQLAAARPPAAAAPSPFEAADAGARPVTFTSSNGTQIVGITAGLTGGAGVGSVSLQLPVGTYMVQWRVTGSGAFSLTAQGATLHGAISSVAPDICV